MILAQHHRTSHVERSLAGVGMGARGAGGTPATGASLARPVSAMGTWRQSFAIEGSSTKPRQSYPCLVGRLANGLDREVDAA